MVTANEVVRSDRRREENREIHCEAQQTVPPYSSLSERCTAELRDFVSDNEIETLNVAVPEAVKSPRSGSS
jgi:hypothetical protein